MLLSGGTTVLVNAWFAWTVRKIDDPRRILAVHIVRFALYGLGIALVIVWRELDVLTCVLTMIGAHFVYVLAMFRNGLMEANSKESNDHLERTD